MKARAWVSCALATLIAVTGCGSEKFSGTYVNDPSALQAMQEAGGMLSQEIVFQQDGTFAVKSETTSPQGVPTQTTATGTYTLKGDKLTMTTIIENGQSAPETSRVPVTYRMADDKTSFEMPEFSWVKYVRR
ncbi:MAG: lipocalin family protein [Armatimonadetes bacterium]|nr:lipocalin family protein [Armatimonadota bacterium]